MEDRLNDIAGGKPFAPPKNINCRCYKLDYHEKDIDDYKGKWIVKIFLKNKTVAHSKNTFDTEDQAKEAIKEAKITGLTYENGSICPPEDIAMMIPMPTL